MKYCTSLLMVGSLSMLACSSDPASTQSGSASSAGTPAVSTPAPAVSGGSVAAPAGATNSGASGATAAPRTSQGAAGSGTAPGSAGSLGSAGGSAVASAAGASAAAGAGAGALASSAGGASGAAGSGSGGAAGAATGSAPGPLTEFKAIYLEIVPLMCPSCHVAGGVFGDVDLSTPELAYTQMYNVNASTGAAAQCGGKGKLIDPGNCEGSILYDKLANAMPKCGGRRMPLSSSTVPQATLDKLCAWIKAGAKPN